MGKLTMTDKSTRMGHEVVDQLVTLRINKAFIERLRGEVIAVEE